MRTGIANFTLDYGRCPRWLFERMVRLGRVISLAVIEEFGTEEFLRRLADPVWFQSLGTVMAFDWNASGLTTTTLGALKMALSGLENEMGVFICGGKGRTSKKTPQQIEYWANRLGFSQQQASQLVYTSKITAKVDSSLIQDGFQLYHHNFIFNKQRKWTVVQQGMNTLWGRARRYHWFGDEKTDFIEEPHSGIATQMKLDQVLDLTAKESLSNRKISLELVKTKKTLFSDLAILANKQSLFSRQLENKQNPQQQFKLLSLPDIEFKSHPQIEVDFSNPGLKKRLEKIIIGQPGTFEKLVMTPGIGGKTMRALSLVGEIIYGAKPSYEDPARYSFALGGKDGTPFPVDQSAYDQTLAILEPHLRRARLPLSEKDGALRRLERVFLASSNLGVDKGLKIML